MVIYLGGNRLSFPVDNFGHLQIVRNGRELEVQPTGGYSGEYSGNSFWQFHNRSVNGTNEYGQNTAGYGAVGLYGQVAIDLGDRSESDTWRILVSITSQFATQMANQIPYNAIFPAFNSNSFANTLLSVIGIDIGGYLGGASPATMFDPITGTTYSFSGFPGNGNTALDYEEYSPNLRLVGGDSVDVLRTGFGDDHLIGKAGDDEFLTSGGNDSVFGGDGNDLLQTEGDDDIVYGGLGNDTLSGGDGIDSLSGGAGNDLLYFDATDSLVQGGGGRDTAIAQGTAPVTMDVGASGLEVVLGSTAADGVTGDTFQNITPGRMVGGGGGNDVFQVSVTEGGSPAIVWGGAGADTFEFTTSGSLGAVGIMVVDVTNLTDGSFLSFQSTMIETGGNLRWGQIDVIILNPDLEDLIKINGVLQGVSTASLQVYDQYYDEDYEEQSDLLTSYSYLSGSLDPDSGAGQADFYRTSFLGGNRDVFAAAANPGYASYFQFDDPDVENYWVETFGPREWDGIYSPNAAQAGETDYRYDLVPGTNYYDHVGYLTAYPNGYAGGSSGYAANGVFVGAATAAGVGTFTTGEAMGPWFVLGGHFDSDRLVSSGAFTATIPPPDLM